MQRGKGRFAIVVGIEPGKTEIELGEAFSGPGGRKLLSWIGNAGIGNNREEIFDRMYFTSLLKCKLSSNSDLPRAVQNCSRFLDEQFRIIQPGVCITLGREPLEHLFGKSIKLSDAVGESFAEDELSPSLFPRLKKGGRIVPFPHPSPLSRWLNEAKNQQKLEKAINELRRLWENIEQ